MEGGCPVGLGSFSEGGAPGFLHREATVRRWLCKPEMAHSPQLCQSDPACGAAASTATGKQVSVTNPPPPVCVLCCSTVHTHTPNPDLALVPTPQIHGSFTPGHFPALHTSANSHPFILRVPPRGRFLQEILPETSSRHPSRFSASLCFCFSYAVHLSLSLIKAEFLLDHGLLASKNWFPNLDVLHSSIAFARNGDYRLGITILNRSD